MTAFLIKVVVSALALYAATELVSGLTVTGPSGQWYSEALLYLVVGAVLAAVNTVIRPIVKVLSFPLYILSLGLFALVVNAAMLELTAAISEATPVTLTIGDFFWSAVGGALVVTVVSLLLNAVLPDGKQ